MRHLIEALSIFVKYKDLDRPTHCEHDVLQIAGITKNEVSAEDQQRLTDLGFLWSDSDECWISYRYGSA